jgi:hypothetical protein
MKAEPSAVRGPLPHFAKHLTGGFFQKFIKTAQ